jgi:hypothetical protein
MYVEAGRCIAAIRARGGRTRADKTPDHKIDVDTKTPEGAILPELSRIDTTASPPTPPGPGLRPIQPIDPKGKKAYDWTSITHDFIDSKSGRPEPVVGRNRITISTADKKDRHTAEQEVHPASALGGFWNAQRP